MQMELNTHSRVTVFVAQEKTIRQKKLLTVEILLKFGKRFNQTT